LKQHLQRVFPSLASGTHHICRSNSTISMAAMAASYPLFSGLLVKASGNYPV